MNVTYFSNEKHMGYEFSIKQPMQMFGRKLKTIFDNISNLIKTLNRDKNHPSIRKNNNILFG